MTPSFSVSAGGADITGGLSDRLVSLTVTDSEGLTSDSCEITLDDRDGTLSIPSRGAILSVSMGYAESGVQFMGLFTVDEVEVSGFPQKMTIRGKSADMRDDLKKPRTGYFDKKTLQQIVSEVAGRNGLGAKVSQSLASFKYEYLPQTEESDMHFLSRLARKHDATMKPANGQLIFVKKGEGGLSGAMVTRTQVIDYSCQLRDRPAVKKAIGTYWDHKKAKRERVEKSGSSDVGPDFEMLHSQPTKEEAEADAQSTADAQARDAGSLSMTLLGDPSMCAEMMVVVMGVRGGVDGMWRIKTATHTLDDGGYTTSIDCELPGSSSGGSGSDGSSGSSSSGAASKTSTGGVPGGTGEDSVTSTGPIDFGGYETPSL